MSYRTSRTCAARTWPRGNQSAQAPMKLPDTLRHLVLVGYWTFRSSRNMRILTLLFLALVILSRTRRSERHNATDKKLTVAFNSGTMKAANMASTDRHGNTEYFAYVP